MNQRAIRFGGVQLPALSIERRKAVRRALDLSQERDWNSITAAYFNGEERERRLAISDRRQKDLVALAMEWPDVTLADLEEERKKRA